MGKIPQLGALGPFIATYRRLRRFPAELSCFGLEEKKPLTRRKAMPHQQYETCIEACNACAVECEHCASACLQERDVNAMAHCIALDRDCAKVCYTASALMASASTFAEEFCKVCADVCRACAEECRKHDMDHCQQCAQACENCAQECERMAVAHAH